MIYIFTAMYCEARGLIAQFHLKKEPAQTRFQVFRKEETGICLTITGTGEIAATAAVCSICTEYGAGPGDFLVNIGVCAGPMDGIFLCNKITEEATGKKFYPDIIYRHDFCENEIVTGISAAEQEKQVLYDMESAAVYQAGSYFLGPHQMSFLKMVSDRGGSEEVTPKQIEGLLEANLEEIASYLLQLIRISSDHMQKESVLGNGSQATVEKLGRDMHCSQVMKASLLQHIRYLTLSGVDYVSVIEKMYQEQKLPCRDKREGKRRFEEFKRSVL